tara:strand:+ start:301 stop:531 length:231 start_codon:yes stop_codon:yes gene_type:complete
MKKIIYIPLAIFCLSGSILGCAEKYDGSIYTGNSMSTKPSDQDLTKEIQVTESEVTPQENVSGVENETAISEENYK